VKNIYVGLVHHPVYNKFGEVVTTSITNLDIHDIARSCRTFGVKKFFIITPLESQKKLLERVLKFWNSEIAIKYNPDRVDALSIVECAQNLTDAKKKINTQEERCLLISTTAANLNNQLTFEDFGDLENSVFLLFGTGNGLTKEIHNSADYVLKPIDGASEYNHLSVRSAVAIVLDRISSEK
jgi:hypothetical protein